ncbi:MAG: ABC transporter substrate-binding protein, partial [Pseudomonadota bacterium]
MQAGTKVVSFGVALAMAGAIALLSFASSANPSGSAEPADGPVRIVVAGGAVTETLYALGLGDRIIAADTTSMFPEAAMKLPKVGYLRQLSAEGVLAMRPDHILLGQGAGPAAAVEQIKSSGLPVSDISSGWTPDSVTGMVRDIGAAIGSPEAADTLATEIDADFAELAASLTEDERPSVLLIM